VQLRFFFFSGSFSFSLPNERCVTLSNEGYEWDKALHSAMKAMNGTKLVLHFGQHIFVLGHWTCGCIFGSCYLIVFTRVCPFISSHADVDQVILGSDFLEFEHDPVFHSLHAERGGVEERVNISLAKIAFVKKKPSKTGGNAGIFGMSSSFKKAAKLEDYVWHDGSLILLAPLSSFLPRFFGASTVSQKNSYILSWRPILLHFIRWM
jgi:hypothetical protein